MTVQLKVDIKGLKEIRHAFKELPKAVEEKELLAGLRKGANVWRDAARSNAQSISSRISKNIVSSKNRPEPGLTATMFVKVKKLSRGAISKFKRETKKSARANPNDPFFWRFWEFGSSTTGSPRKFMRAAFEGNKQQAFDVTVPHWRKRIEAAVRKLGARAPRR